MSKFLRISLFALSAVLLFSQCTPDEPIGLEPEPGEELSGGLTTIFDFSPNSFGFQAPNLTEDQELFFFVGNSLFNQNWVSAPASTTARDGLGPLFNARSCSGCHFKDGRGRPPVSIGERTHGLLLRMSAGSGPNGEPLSSANYGLQLQDQSVLGVDTEADFEITYEEIVGSYPDGTPYSLRKPFYRITALTQGAIEDVMISPRVAPQLSGMGLLDALSEETILGFADEFDEDQDGISGRPNRIWDIESQRWVVGRFGWKSNEPNTRQQVAAAFAGDMGITSSLFPEENCPPNVDCESLPNGGEPEIPEDDLGHVVLYTSSLAVPGRRDWEDQDVLMGKLLFNQLNCSGCHIPKMTTSEHPIIDAFSFQDIRPYTDLLLHDMGEGLADNRPEFVANGQEWRTPPLWGIGLFDIVNRHTNYLHDGRARNLEEAILWHGGEAEASKVGFMELSAKEREQIILFLNSL
ncbi:MAG: di-heme oxidoredictase family protein [Bacteroidota bacterium]